MKADEIGARLRAARKKTGKSLKDVAEALGCSVQSISQYERGIRPLKMETALKIAEFLQIPLGELITLEEFRQTFPKRQMALQIPVEMHEEMLREIRDVEVEAKPDDVSDAEPSPEECARLADQFCRLNAQARRKVLDYTADLNGIPRYLRVLDLFGNDCDFDMGQALQIFERAIAVKKREET